MSDAEATAADRETLLSFLLKASSKETVSGDGQPQTLHPFASTKPDDPVAFLNNIINSSSVLQNSLQSYSSFLASDFKLISNLRQGTALIHNLHNVSLSAYHIQCYQIPLINPPFNSIVK